MATEAEIAWAAALFEGEGTIGSYCDRRQRAPRPAMRLAMADKDVVERFASYVGTRTVVFLLTPSQIKRGYKPMYVWQTRSKPEIRRVCAALLPWLGERRSKQVARALEHAADTNCASRTHCPRGHEYTPENTYYHQKSDRPGPSRFCRECNRLRAKADYDRKKKVAD